MKWNDGLTDHNDDLEEGKEQDNTTEVEIQVSDPVCNPIETAIDEVTERVDEAETALPDGESITESLGEPAVEAESGLVVPRQEKSRQQKQRRGPKNHFGQGEGNDVEIASLTKKLHQAKKINAELHTQLQRFYTNDVVIQDDFPSKKRALQEELRVCKERIKQLKEQNRVADEKSLKLHQQSFDLAVKNKGLSEKLRLLEGTSCVLLPTPSSGCLKTGAPIGGPSVKEVQTILTSQEEEITRLHQRAALMKKRHKAEQAKYERLLKTSQDEIDSTRFEMEQFYLQIFAKERAARVQLLHMKKLKHALHELANMQQTNQRFQPFLANREMRIMNRSNNNNARHHQAGPQSSQKGPVIKAGRWITEALHHLGFVMPATSQLDELSNSSAENVPEEQVNIPDNCIQGRLVPVPPSATRFAVGTSSARSQLYNGSNDSTRKNGDISDVSEESNGEDGEEDQVTTVTPASTNATAQVPHVPENPERRTILTN
ncbi:uncharacterized protein PITG_10988 [Phytophthora infestans T30-4]|uniref:Uncharacterized protein n=1 Tax=Phytophthora infestans (strain T30-4) TaxID=403677 RepID=D0NFW7_PHYIT|nr:uncharacterized protein PITG_10988 [Phytophthora infestans T30-4]EEY57168.1 conserved hypothetical protein [Phytophthora infestans T30-4]|eukprot:XP_002901778.1 conserved hypothetical protein [Phytophthora infestans T30-4]